MIVPLPEDLARVIAERATRYTREYSQKRNWSSASTQSFQPTYAGGQAGVKTTRRHLLYQEWGTRPYVMWSLEGKTIPMGDGQFRRARGVGQPGYVTLPGGVRVWREQKWRHPGLKPLHYIENALGTAIMELHPWIKQILVKRLTSPTKMTSFGEQFVTGEYK